MKGSINYVMVIRKDGSKVRVTREAYEAYVKAKKSKSKTPELRWTL